MFADVSFGLVMGYLGIALALLSTFMRSMQPLRVVAIIGNLTGLIYGYLDSVWPTFFGNLMLLPINGYRLWEIRQMAHAINRAQQESSLIELLLPHMKYRRLPVGATLFSKGEEADTMYYLKSGSIHLVEIDKHLPEGTILGEVGMFAHDARRTLSAACLTDCEVYDMTKEQLFTLYFQNPSIGFKLMQMLVENLLDRRPPPPRDTAPGQIR